ncbi:hypothetical protein NDI56_20880 [Haloarcula sp. S1CR25-12]|uniref:Uncharacterized protein n=1 Tax=Haloarcula saliterrae TaxID=2950534 RepID=A0ABU2FHY1_9EURY|nr:hypothetical protein [Haloarcula sp. S1CR25-12]MDS0261863.1 hypothetical protein [Haloarcula sp. S1CR25-12]
MDAELERLIDGLLNDIACYSCGSEFVIQASRLTREDERVYTAPHSCPGCEAEYEVTVKDDNQLLTYEADRLDETDEHRNMFSSARKEGLQRQTHPIRELVEGFGELRVALNVLWENRERIQDACDTFRDEGLDDRSAEFDRRVNTDVHNYMASAYTFNQILQTIDSNIPTDGPVEAVKGEFEDEERLILGLRVYAQHNLSLPFSYVHFTDENTGSRETTLGVELEEVNVIEPDIDTYGPDGYKEGSDYHYENVEGDTINIERRIDLHYEAAKELVDAVGTYAETEHGDELEDFREATTYDAGR